MFFFYWLIHLLRIEDLISAIQHHIKQILQLFLPLNRISWIRMSNSAWFPNQTVRLNRPPRIDLLSVSASLIITSLRQSTGDFFAELPVAQCAATCCCRGALLFLAAADQQQGYRRNTVCHRPPLDR